LFRAIGIIRGAGNNSTTFNIPDFCGMFFVVWAMTVELIRTENLQSSRSAKIKNTAMKEKLTYQEIISTISLQNCLPVGAGWSGNAGDETKTAAQKGTHKHTIIQTGGGKEAVRLTRAPSMRSRPEYCSQAAFSR